MGSTTSRQHARLSDDDFLGINETKSDDQQQTTGDASGNFEVKGQRDYKRSLSSSVLENRKCQEHERDTAGVNKRKVKPPMFGRSASSVDTSYLETGEVLLDKPTTRSARPPVLRSLSSPLFLDGLATSEYRSFERPDLDVGNITGLRDSDEDREQTATPPSEGATKKPAGRRRNLISPVAVNFNIRTSQTRSSPYTKMGLLEDDT